MKKISILLMLMALFGPLAMMGQTTLLSQNFDGNGFTPSDGSYSASGWYMYNAGSGNNWQLYQGDTYAHSGSYCMAYSYSSSYAANCYLVSEPFNVSANMTELTVSLWESVMSSSWAETFEVFFIKASDVNSSTLIPATSNQYGAIPSASYTNTYENYAQVSGSSTNPALAGQSVRVVVHCTSAKNMYRLYIDNITVTETTSGGGGQGGGCDYSEDFEGVTGTSGYSTAGSLPTGWDYIWNYSTSPAYAAHVYSSSASTPGQPSTGNYLGFYASGSTSEYSYAIMPAFAAGEAANHISFKYKFESTGQGTLTYGVIDGTDASTYTILGTVSNPSSNPGTVDVNLNMSQTAGKRIAFCWYKTSTWYTCGIDDICVMTGTVTNCPTPDDLAVYNITPNSANISWTDNGSESYELQYGVVSTSTPDPLWLQYDDGTADTGFGSSTSSEQTWGVMYPASMLNGNNTVTKFAMYEYSTWQTASTYTVRFYTGGSSSPGTLVGTQTVNMSGNIGMHEVTLTTPVTIDPSQNLWIVVTTTGTYVKVCYDAGEQISNNQWVLNGSSWVNMASLNSNMTNYGFMIRGYVEFVGSIDPNSITWTTVTPDSIPYMLTGLGDETQYAVRLRANCGSDGYSGWTAAETFTTLSACAAPTGLTSQLNGNAAMLSWDDYQNNYNVRYKEGFVYDFESATPWTYTDFSPCTTYDGDGTSTYYFSNWSFTNQGYTGACIAFQNTGSTMVAHSGNAFGAMFNPQSSTVAANDWFILPELTIKNGDVLSFWAREITSQYGAETINVGVCGSTDGTFASYLAQNVSVSTIEWTEYSYDLSSYAGQTIKLAINCVSLDIFGVMIDDIFVGPSTSSWSNPISCNSATCTLQGLDPKTNYVWQVQGVNCDGNGNPTDWSASAYFTTGEFYVKHIVSYSDTSIQDWDGWYLITSPLATATDPANVANMTSNIYDLYRFNQSPAINEGVGLEWINYKDQNFNVNQEFGSLYAGTGYLYANSQDVDLVFTGTAYNGTGVFSLTYNTTNPDSNMHGWNLVGNPFNTTGTDIMLGTGNVRAMDGIFVRATAANQTVTFTKPSKGNATTNGESVMINLSKDQKVIDRAAVSFDEGDQLPKFQLYQNSTKIYIPVDGVDYAVVSSEGIGELPFSFKAEQNGTYTLSLNSEGVSFGYLHLIDNMTGNDIDMLVNPSYSFEARTTDYSQRFKLVFATGDNTNDNFAFFSNGSFVINNDGAATLQVIDITGRILKSESINGCTNVNVNAAPGVYMIRLINGTDVKVQKVVVK